MNTTLNRFLAAAVLLISLTPLHATDYTTDGQFVTIPVQSPAADGPRVVRLQVVGDRIIRVQATSAASLPKKAQSLIVVPQTAKPEFTVAGGSEVTVRTAAIEARVNRSSGRVSFFDSCGRLLLRETDDGKTFRPFRVPDREIGVDVARVSERQRNGLSWLLQFERQPGVAAYGLGQHQSEELNMVGKNEDLYQYNTKVSIPFVLTSNNCGILWDSYSYCRWGQPDDYQQLGNIFKIYDRQGTEGHLTGTYIAQDGKRIVRDEDSIYFEFDTPAASLLARQTERGGIRNLPQGFVLNGSTVVYEGFVEAPEKAVYNFILYYAGYVKVYIGGQEVVPERWRTAWNPNSYKFTVPMEKGLRQQLRIEWKPDGWVSYCGLRASRQTDESSSRMRIWSEMSKDMDYYFISGDNADQVISGYRTLTGRASLYPKWALGFWQSRERYKTQQEITSTLAEFRKRGIPCDNIVQDWNYWPEDQWGSHRFESSRYPDPQAMLDSVHRMGGHFMISVWPKFYCNTANYKELDRKGWMYHQAVVDSIRDWVGPGYMGSFYDAYSAGARKMFWRQMDENLYRPTSQSLPCREGSDYSQGGKSTKRLSTPLPTREGLGGGSLIDAWWMDASEPNVRDCTPLWYRKALCGPTALGTSTEYFNAYALVNAQAIYEGQRGLSTPLSNRSGAGAESPRVFLLTRSGFAGLQRYSTATWSGDIGTRWEDMRAQMTAGQNYSLSGLPFWGMDQGGFCVEDRYVKAQQLFDRTGAENEDLKEWRELQTRWSQFGAFIPLFRVHGQWPAREIWNIAPDGHPAYRSFVYYDRLRYQLMPYIYSMAGWVHFSDYTMMRGLVMDFADDPMALDVKDQWMFGPALMACPVGYYKARNRSVYFPAGSSWYDLYSGEQTVDSKLSGRRLVVDAPYERIPVFVRGGSIIPFGPEMQYTDEKPAELINLYVYAGCNGTFQLYEDEGVNYNYEQGYYSTIDITYDDAARTLTIGDRKGQFSGMLSERRFNIVYVTPDSPRALDLASPRGRMVQYSGSSVTVNL